MASTINAISTGAGGLISSGDASGQLQLQTNSTTALTIDASQNATFVGTVAATSYTGSGAALTGIVTGGMTLLGTVTGTTNSISLGSLNLTSYTALFIGIVAQLSGPSNNLFINSTNAQSVAQFNNVGVAGTFYGSAWISLATGGLTGSYGDINGYATGAGNTSISTATTTIYFRCNSTQVFGASTSFKVYGVK